jgi:hypothetical protein
MSHSARISVLLVAGCWIASIPWLAGVGGLAGLPVLTMGSGLPIVAELPLIVSGTGAFIAFGLIPCAGLLFVSKLNTVTANNRIRGLDKETRATTPNAKGSRNDMSTGKNE